MNKPEDQSQNDANELNNVPNPPVEELSEDELDQVAGGALNAYLKLDGIKGEVSQKIQGYLKIDTFKPGQ